MSTPSVNSYATVQQTSNTATVTFPSIAVNKGDLIVVSVAGIGSSATISWSDTIGNTYTKIFSSNVENGTGSTYANMYYCISTGANADNVITGSISAETQIQGCAVDFTTGLSQTSVDVTGSKSSSSGTTWAVRLDTSNADDFVVFGWGSESASLSSYTMSSGTVITHSTGASIQSCIGYLALTSTVDTSYTLGTLSSSANAYGMAAAFKYQATAPDPTSVSADSGPSKGGTSVTITGTGFNETVSGVTFGGNAATDVSYTNSTTITCTTPAGTAGTSVNVAVTQDTGTGTLDDGFSYNAAPTVTGVSPVQGLPGGSTSVTITGTGFDDTVSSVTFGGNAATDVTYVSSTEITCKTPAGTAGTAVNVVVVDDNGTGTLDNGFVYISPGIPAYYAGGYDITNTGVDVATTSSFGASLGNFLFVCVGGWTEDDTPTISDVCGSTWNKVFTDDVVNGGGSTYWNCWWAFCVSGNSEETVTATFGSDQTYNIGISAVALSGVAGAVAVDTTGTGGGDETTATISDYSTDNASDFVMIAWGGRNVDFSSYTLTSTSSVSPSIIQNTGSNENCSIGIGLQVLTATQDDISYTAGTMSSANEMEAMAISFTFNSSPVVTGIQPIAGLTSGGTPCVISGSSFDDSLTSIKFGSNSATDIAYVSATELTCTSPSGSGTVDITVTDSDNGSGTLDDGFQYFSSGPFFSAYAVSPSSSARENLSLTLPVNEGDLLLLVSLQGSDSQLTLSDTIGNTFSHIGSGYVGGGNYISVSYAFSTGSNDADEVSFGYENPQFYTTIVCTFSGWPGSSSLDTSVASSEGSSGTTVTTADLTTSNKKDLVLAFWGATDEEFSSFTAQTGFTVNISSQTASDAYGIGIASQIVNAILTDQTYTLGTLASSDSQGYVVAAFTLPSSSSSTAGRMRWRNRNLN